MSILFFIAKMIADACSAALPTIGSKIVETKASGIPNSFADVSIVFTMYSERSATSTVRTASQNRLPPLPSTASSSSSSSPPPPAFSAAGAASGRGESGAPTRDSSSASRVSSRRGAGARLLRAAILVEEVGVRHQLEVEVGKVHRQQDDRAEARERELVGALVVDAVQRGARGVEDRRQQDGQRAEDEERVVRADHVGVEGLHLLPQAATEEGGAEHEQQVRQHRAQQRQLHDAQQAAVDGEDGDEHLGDVAKRRVEQPADGRVRVHRELLGHKAEPLRERQSASSGDEDEPVAQVEHRAADRERHADQQDVELGAEEQLLHAHGEGRSLGRR